MIEPFCCPFCPDRRPAISSSDPRPVTGSVTIIIHFLRNLSENHPFRLARGKNCAGCAARATAAAHNGDGQAPIDPAATDDRRRARASWLSLAASAGADCRTSLPLLVIACILCYNHSR